MVFYIVLKKIISKKKNIFIYGAGGGVGQVISEFLIKDCKKILLYNRKIKKIKYLKDLSKKVTVIKDIKNYFPAEPIDIFINCSSIKLSNFNILLKKKIKKFFIIRTFFDVNYNFKNKEIKKIEKFYKFKFITGKKMNLNQAILAIKIVFPRIRISKIEDILKKIK